MAFLARRRSLFDRFDRFWELGLRESSSGGEDGRSVASVITISWTFSTGASEFIAGVGSLVAGVGDEPMYPSSFSVGARVGVKGMSLVPFEARSLRK